jgi:hypothetical protein
MKIFAIILIVLGVLGTPSLFINPPTFDNGGAFFFGRFIPLMLGIAGVMLLKKSKKSK